MRRDYYYLSQVEGTDFGFTMGDLLHSGSIGILKLYVQVKGPIALRSQIDGEYKSFDSFYLRLRESDIYDLERTYAAESLKQNSDLSHATKRKHRIYYGIVDERFEGAFTIIGHEFSPRDEFSKSIPVQLHYYSEEGPILASEEFTRDEILCFTEDLERLMSLPAFRDRALAKPMRDLSTVERNSLYRMILGMAIEKYGYDPDSKRNPATGENAGSIYADLERLGLAVDADTIREHLKTAFKTTPPDDTT